LQDLDSAEALGYADLSVLNSTRANIFTLIGDTCSAESSWEIALDSVTKTARNNKVLSTLVILIA
jgi:hypothetical protein